MADDDGGDSWEAAADDDEWLREATKGEILLGILVVECGVDMHRKKGLPVARDESEAIDDPVEVKNRQEIKGKNMWAVMTSISCSVKSISWQLF